MILMQELNLASKYPVIYWKTACLSVNSGLVGAKEGNTDYGAIAKAVGDMKGTVLNPDINRSGKGFTPLEEDGKILFGLKPIAGLGKDALEVIFLKRPFTSLEDFVQRAILSENHVYDDEGNIIEKDPTISDKKGVILIKAGALDRLCPNKTRREIMIDYVNLIIKDKDKLTMTNLPHIINDVPKKYDNHIKIWQLRERLFGRKKEPMNVVLEGDFLDFCETFKTLGKIDYEFKNGKLIVDKKSFDKVYNKAIEPLKEWLKSKEAVDIFNRKKKQEFWKANCMGTIEAWEMETVTFYSGKHELDYMPLNKYFNIGNFFELESNKIVGYKEFKNKRYPRYQLNVIAGTVVDKNKSKHIVYLLTQYGVVPVKYHKGAFLHYDKKVVDVSGETKTILDPSWFDRGTKLVIIGYKRGEEFVPKVYKETAYAHTTMKILNYNKNEIYFQMEKVKI